MMHESSVLCVNFSIDSELLASGIRFHHHHHLLVFCSTTIEAELTATPIGASDGNVKVWSVATGQCIRRFDHAHAQGITAISFMRDASKIVTCSFDETVRSVNTHARTHTHTRTHARTHTHTHTHAHTRSKMGKNTLN